MRDCERVVVMHERPWDTALPAGWTAEDFADLREAKRKLEYPSLAIRIADTLGAPIEAGMKMLPHGWQGRASKAVENALLTALEFSVKTMGRGSGTRALRSHDWFHKALVVSTGTAGGAVGLAALPVELPVSTTIILRSIADIARAEGHDITQLEVRLACLEVFALGGKGTLDDAAETGYWAVRTALSRQVTEAARFIAERGVTDKSAPVIVRLIQKIAPRFASVVGEQLAAKAAPLLGAFSGGAVNYLFMAHFQDVASGHFVVMRLEKKYGIDAVRHAYDEAQV